MYTSLSGIGSFCADKKMFPKLVNAEPTEKHFGAKNAPNCSMWQNFLV